MNCYSHLSIGEREKILEYHAQGKGIREIGLLLNRSPSTISREMKRNKRADNHYSPNAAQSRYREKRKCCIRKYILSDNHALCQKIRWLLVHLWWSPEQISNRLKLESNSAVISTSTIYRAFSNGCLDSSVQRHLRRYTRTNRVKAPGKGGSNRNYSRSIHERPLAADNRTEPGHLEGDTIKLKNNGIVVSIVDRYTRMLYTAHLPNYDSTRMKKAVKDMLLCLPKDYRKTLTLDRGTEFAKLPELENDIGIACYFCDPASPRQKATNENFNGLLRQFFPKNSITFNPTLQLDSFTALINLRPRKCLLWAAPWEIHSNSLLHFA